MKKTMTMTMWMSLLWRGSCFFFSSSSFFFSFVCSFVLRDHDDGDGGGDGDGDGGGCSSSLDEGDIRETNVIKVESGEGGSRGEEDRADGEGVDLADDVPVVRVGWVSDKG